MTEAAGTRSRDNEARYHRTQCELRNRYKLALSHDVWTAWHEALARRDPAMMLLEARPAFEVWRAWLGLVPVYLRVADGLIETALYPRTEYSRLVLVVGKKRAEAAAEQRKLATAQHQRERKRRMNREHRQRKRQRDAAMRLAPTANDGGASAREDRG